MPEGPQGRRVRLERRRTHAPRPAWADVWLLPLLLLSAFCTGDPAAAAAASSLLAAGGSEGPPPPPPPPSIVALSSRSCTAGSPGLAPSGCARGTLEISGSGFAGGGGVGGSASVRLSWAGGDSVPAPAAAPTCDRVAVATATRLTCTLEVPPGASGRWTATVVVAAAGGASSASEAGKAFLVTVGPRPTLLRVAAGPCAGGLGTLAAVGCSPGRLVLAGSGFDVASPRGNRVHLRGGEAPNGAPTCGVVAVAADSVTCDLKVTPSTSGVWTLAFSVGGTDDGGGEEAAARASLQLQNAAPVVGTLGLASCTGSPSRHLRACVGGGVLTVSGTGFDPRPGVVNEVLLRREGEGGSGGDGVEPPLCAAASFGDGGVEHGLLHCDLSFAAGSSGLWQVVVRTGGVASLAAIASLEVATSVAPVVTGAAGGGCVEGGLRDSLTGCRGGVLTVHGRHFAARGAAVANSVMFRRGGGGGGGPAPSCDMVAAGAATHGMLLCRLHAPQGAGEGGAWTVGVVSNGVPSAQDAVVVGVVSAPVVAEAEAEAAGCARVAEAEAATATVALEGCAGRGRMVLRGWNLLGAAVVFAPRRVAAAASVTVLLPHCRAVSGEASARSLVCDYDANGAEGVFDLMVVPAGEAAASAAAAAAVVVGTMAPMLAPEVAAATGGGCRALGARSLAGCVGGQLRVEGRGFAGLGGVAPVAGVSVVFAAVDEAAAAASPPTCAVTSVSDEGVVCELRIAAAGVWDLRVRSSHGLSARAVHLDAPAVRPRVAVLSGGGCVRETALSLAACVGGLLTVAGGGFAAGSGVAFVGGAGPAPVCEAAASTSDTLRCVLGVPAGAGGRWEVVVTPGLLRPTGGPAYLHVRGPAAPKVAALEGGGCDDDGDGAATRRTGCRGGVLTVVGDHFNPHDAALNAVRFVAVDGRAAPPPVCRPVAAGLTVRRLRCHLSAPAAVADGAWQVRVAVAGGGTAAGASSATLQAVHAPVAFSLSGAACVDPVPVPAAAAAGADGEAAAALVCPSGLLSVAGANLAAGASLKFVGGAGEAPTCRVRAVAARDALTCDLAVPAGAEAGGVWRLVVVSADGVSSDAAAGPVLRAQNPPTVSGVTGGGCGGDGGDAWCTGGRLLVSGAGFVRGETAVSFVAADAAAAATAAAAAPSCAVAVLAATTSLHCELRVSQAAAPAAWALVLSTRGVPSADRAVLRLRPPPPSVEAVLAGGGCSGAAHTRCRGGGVLVLRGTSFHPEAARNRVVFARGADGAGDAPSCAVRGGSGNETTLSCDLLVFPGTTGEWRVSVAVDGDGGGGEPVGAAVSLSFAPLLELRSVRGGGCAAAASAPLLAVAACTGGRSTGDALVIAAAAPLHPTRTSVEFVDGPVPRPTCDTLTVAGTTLRCVLRFAPGFAPPAEPAAWTAVVRSGGQVSESALSVTPYTSAGKAATVTAVSGARCEAVAEEETDPAAPSREVRYCHGGEVLVLHGRHFNALDASTHRVVFDAVLPSEGAAAPTAPSCAPLPSGLRPDRLRCALTVPAGAAAGGLALWRVRVFNTAAGALPPPPPPQDEPAVHATFFNAAEAPPGGRLGASLRTAAARVTLRHDIDGFGAALWRVKVARLVRGRVAAAEAASVTAARVVVVAAAAGSTVVDTAFSEVAAAADADAGGAQQQEGAETARSSALLAVFLRVLQEDASARAFLYAEEGASEVSVEVPAALRGPPADVLRPPSQQPPASPSGGDRYWWLAVLIPGLCCIGVAAAGAAVLAARRRGASSSSEDEEEEAAAAKAKAAGFDDACFQSDGGSEAVAAAAAATDASGADEAEAGREASPDNPLHAAFPLETRSPEPHSGSYTGSSYTHTSYTDGIASLPLFALFIFPPFRSFTHTAPHRFLHPRRRRGCVPPKPRISGAPPPPPRHHPGRRRRVVASHPFFFCFAFCFPCAVVAVVVAVAPAQAAEACRADSHDGLVQHGGDPGRDPGAASAGTRARAA